MKIEDKRIIQGRMKHLCDEFLSILKDSEISYKCKEGLVNEVGLTYIINIMGNMIRLYDADIDLMLDNIRVNLIKFKMLYKSQQK